jgi:(p)ppGpp synthase/HD superfamily hydrolase
MSETQKPVLGPRFEQALVYAAHLHNNQTRKVREVPYISHLLSVTALVLQDGGSEVEAIAALMHDAPEDQGGLIILKEIRMLFGEQVAEIVAGCSDTFDTPKPPWRDRKEAHIAHLREASPQVLRVLLADKLHNARSLLRDLRASGESIWQKFKGGKGGTLWYYQAVLAIYAETDAGYMRDELARVVGEIETLANEDAHE